MSSKDTNPLFATEATRDEKSHYKIPSEILEPAIAHFIGLQLAIHDAGEGLTPAVADKMITAIRTIGSFAHMCGAVHAGFCCDNTCRDLTFIAHGLPPGFNPRAEVERSAAVEAEKTRDAQHNAAAINKRYTDA